MQKALIIIGFLAISFPSLAQDDQSQAQTASASNWAAQLFSAFGVAAPSEIFISDTDTQESSAEYEASQQDGFNPFSNTTTVSF